MASNHLDEMLDFAISAAQEAGRITLEFFRSDLAVRTKGDRSPVTMADLKTEEKLRLERGVLLPFRCNGFSTPHRPRDKVRMNNRDERSWLRG